MNYSTRKSKENKKRGKKVFELQTQLLNTSRMSHATGMDSPVGKRN